MDRRRRARHRHAGGGPAPLRRVHGQALPGEEERGNLPQRLHHSLSGRGAPRRAARQDQPRLRPDQREGRGLGPALRLGARQLVRPTRRRATRPLELPAQQLLRARRQRGAPDARARRHHRSHPVHQARGDRAQRGEPGSTAWWPTRCPPRSAAWRCRTRSRAAAASARNSPSPRSPSSTTTW